MPVPTLSFETESGSTYEVYRFGHAWSLVKVGPDAQRTTVVINVWDVPALRTGERAVFKGHHPYDAHRREYRLTTSPVVSTRSPYLQAIDLDASPKEVPAMR